MVKICQFNDIFNVMFGEDKDVKKMPRCSFGKKGAGVQKSITPFFRVN